MSSASASDTDTIELPQELSTLLDHVEARPESFVHGDAEIRSAALAATKFLFDRAVQSEDSASVSIDDILKSIQSQSAGPVTRSAKANQKAALTSDVPALQKFGRTPIDALFLDGMGPDQIWEQLELRTKNICSTLDSLIERENGSDADGEGEGSSKAPGSSSAMDLDGDDDAGGLNNDSDEEEETEEEEEEGEEDSDEADLGEESILLRDPESEGDDDDDDEQQGPIRRGPRHPVLDDDFFSIDNFNRQTEMLEAKRRTSGRLAKKDDEESSEDEDADDGIDYFAPIGGSGEAEDDGDSESDMGSGEESGGGNGDEEDAGDEEADGIGGGMDLTGMNDVRYGDFFAPPPRFADSGPPGSSQLRPFDRKGKGRADPVPDEEEAPPRSKPKKAGVGVRFAENVRVKKIKARGKGVSIRMMEAAMAADDYDDGEDIDETGGLGMSMPFMAVGPGGFGGFAPRQPVVNGNGAAPHKGDGGDSDEDEEEEDEDEDEDGDEDDSEEYEGEEMEIDDEGLQSIARMKDDIYGDEEEDRAPEAEMSTHEKRMAAIAKEMATLEDENVGVKDWTLMGEANARMRPENSLLATDLDFEHIAKSVPIITEEVTKTLEDMIKQRVLANQFDDVVRQGSVDEKAFLPSKVFELQDSQSRKSLAQIYEDEYTAGASGDKSVIDDRDGKLAKEHEELERTWNDICYKLDALSNAHFTPKQPKAVITSVSNVVSTTLESALPTSVSTSTLMAPQEVFSHDVRAMKAKTELTPSEKKNIRGKVKKAAKRNKVIINGALSKVTMVGPTGKRGTANGAAGFSGTQQPKTVNQAKGMALDSLVKTGKGVTVVGKEHVGKAKKKGEGLKNAGGLKL